MNRKNVKYWNKRKRVKKKKDIRRRREKRNNEGKFEDCGKEKEN